ncbi:U11/U12 small nuclear ribonucleoprotein 25 kDa protein-like [Lolium perenne]|uniref:U11/U12 small nuclear ribonucleoprotein 25 kDa protein-like n=1 Tax=Lolium perenne TaxID=4522 RepID=UPI003A9A082C
MWEAVALTLAGAAGNSIARWCSRRRARDTAVRAQQALDQRLPPRHVRGRAQPRSNAACIGALACGRASFSYHRLPEPRLRLVIRKLDDSYFDVQIARSAAVWELKAAIEGFFIGLYDDMANAITWRHVWSHFCLCFKDEKLTDDKATLRVFGIKDGDENWSASGLLEKMKGLSERRKLED